MKQKPELKYEPERNRPQPGTAVSVDWRHWVSDYCQLLIVFLPSPLKVELLNR